MRVSADEFAEKMKTVGSSFPVTGIVSPKEGGNFNGEGTILRTEDRFCIHLTFPPGGEGPASRGGIYTRDDFWRFEGLIADNLPVVVEHLDPGGTRYWSNGITAQDYEADTLLLSPVGPDDKPTPSCKTSGMWRRVISAIRNLLDRLKKRTEADVPPPDHADLGVSGPVQIRESERPPKPLPYVTGTWIHALVLDFPLIHQNGGTEFKEQNDFLGKSSRSAADTFSGSFDGVQYGLVKRGDDLNVYLFLSGVAVDKTPSVGSNERLLTAFLTGLAFATGQHCWPYRVLIHGNGEQLLDKIRPFRKFDHTPLGPFSERIGFNAAVGNIEWNFADFLAKATRFFNSDSALSGGASKALWLVRAAGAKRTPGEITLSSLCILLESLALMMFEELNLESKEEAASFEEAKKQVKGWLEQHPRTAEPGFSRLRNLVGSASLLRPVDKYRAVCDHLGLKWEGLMKDAWDTWDSVRHKKLHAALAPEARKPVHDHFAAVGRIAGAINILVLRLIGYSGITRTSVFEDKHQRI
jgi:hypothetical protein